MTAILNNVDVSTFHHYFTKRVFELESQFHFTFEQEKTFALTFC